VNRCLRNQTNALPAGMTMTKRFEAGFTQRHKERRKGAENSLRLLSLTLRLCVKTDSNLFVMVILHCDALVWFLRQRFTGHTIFAFDPLTQVDELAPLRTEGTKRIVFPLDWLTAGWTFHES